MSVAWCILNKKSSDQKRYKHVALGNFLIWKPVSMIAPKEKVIFFDFFIWGGGGGGGGGFWVGGLWGHVSIFPLLIQRPVI